MDEIRPRLQRLWAFQGISAGVVVAWFISESREWGLLCYLIGINLIALGYLRLARQASTASGEVAADSEQ